MDRTKRLQAPCWPGEERSTDLAAVTAGSSEDIDASSTGVRVVGSAVRAVAGGAEGAAITARLSAATLGVLAGNGTTNASVVVGEPRKLAWLSDARKNFVFLFSVFAMTGVCVKVW